MKFICEVRYRDRDDVPPWAEHYDVETEDPHAWACDTVERFNASFPPPMPREIVSVNITDSFDHALHTWVPKVSIKEYHYRKAGIYDAVICANCQVTGKRMKQDKHVTIDSKFKAKPFRFCDTAREYLQNSNFTSKDKKGKSK